MEYTDAPSMPMKTHTVNSMIPWSCSDSGMPEFSPQKSSVNLSQLKPTNAMSTMKARMGTSLAIVVIKFIAAACLMPRVSAKKIPHVKSDTEMAITHVLSGSKNGM